MARSPVLALIFNWPRVAVLRPATPVVNVTLAVAPFTVRDPDCVPASVRLPVVTVIKPVMFEVVRLLVPEFMVRLLSVAEELAVRFPPLSVVLPLTWPVVVVIVVLPPVRQAFVMLPAFCKSPPDCVRLATVLPVMLAVPVTRDRLLRAPPDVRLPAVTVVMPPTRPPPPLIVVLPPVRLTLPVMLAVLVTVPFDCVRLVAVPPVRLAVPA